MTKNQYNLMSGRSFNISALAEESEGRISQDRPRRRERAMCQFCGRPTNDCRNFPCTSRVAAREGM